MWRVLLCGLVLEWSAVAQVSAPVHLPSGVVAGNILSKPAPPNLCPFHASGSWIARVVIDEAGSVVQTEMVNKREGDTAYLAWVRQLRYKPFQQNGQPVRVTSTITLTESCGV